MQTSSRRRPRKDSHQTASSPRQDEADDDDAQVKNNDAYPEESSTSTSTSTYYYTQYLSGATNRVSIFSRGFFYIITFVHILHGLMMSLFPTFTQHMLGMPSIYPNLQTEGPSEAEAEAEPLHLPPSLISENAYSNSTHATLMNVRGFYILSHSRSSSGILELLTCALLLWLGSAKTGCTLLSTISVLCTAVHNSGLQRIMDFASSPGTQYASQFVETNFGQTSPETEPGTGTETAAAATAAEAEASACTATGAQCDGDLSPHISSMILSLQGSVAGLGVMALGAFMSLLLSSVRERKERARPRSSLVSEITADLAALIYFVMGLLFILIPLLVNGYWHYDWRAEGSFSPLGEQLLSLNFSIFGVWSVAFALSLYITAPIVALRALCVMHIHQLINDGWLLRKLHQYSQTTAPKSPSITISTSISFLQSFILFRVAFLGVLYLIWRSARFERTDSTR